SRGASSREVRERLARDARADRRCKARGGAVRRRKSGRRAWATWRRGRIRARRCPCRKSFTNKRPSRRYRGLVRGDGGAPHPPGRSPGDDQMFSMKRLAGGVALTTLLCGMSSGVYAQETTGAIRGVVTDEAGAVVPNATVTVTHVPTGASSTPVAGAEGGFSTRGLRVGGPYRVRASADGYDAGGVTVQSIGVGDAAQVEVVLSKAGDGTEVAELVVTAAAAAPSQGGPSSNFTTT